MSILKEYFRERPYLRLGAIIIILILSSLKIVSELKPIAECDRNYIELQKLKGKKSTSKFYFAVFGDNRNSFTTFEYILRNIDSDPDILFAIDLGDLVQDGEREKYKYFLRQIKNFRTPLLTAVGNHDIRERGRALYYDIFGPFYYSFASGNSYFIVLDDADQKGLTKSQEAWLIQGLEKGQKYQHRFVFLHVPLFDPRTIGYDKHKIEILGNRTLFYHALSDMEEAKSLADLFAHHRVTHIFASHIHAYYTGQWAGIPYTITGGAGAELWGTDPQHCFYHYLKIGVDGEKLSYKLIKVSTPPFEYGWRIIHSAYMYLRAFLVFHYLEIIMVVLILVLIVELYLAKIKGRAERLGKKDKRLGSHTGLTHKP